METGNIFRRHSQAQHSYEFLSYWSKWRKTIVICHLFLKPAYNYAFSLSEWKWYKQERDWKKKKKKKKNEHVASRRKKKSDIVVYIPEASKRTCNIMSDPGKERDSEWG